MKKILIAALATSFALGFNTTYASENPAPVSDVVTAAPAETSQNDKNIVIYEIESDAPNKGADYLVLLNKGNEPVSLKGWYIEDDKGAAERFTFADRTLAPGEKLKLEKDAEGSFTFGIGKNDHIKLYNANDDLIHEHTWSAHAAGILRLDPATGIFSDVADPNATPETPAPEEKPAPIETPNKTEVVESGIIINEVQSKGANDAKDYVELRNVTDKDISLKGWYIRDNDEKNQANPLGDITIKAGGYVVLTEDKEFNFGLGKNDTVSLYNANGKLVDQYTWPRHEEGKVWSRDENGTWSITDPTPGAANPKPSKEDAPSEQTLANSPVVINEVESSDASGGKDYAEIYNKSDKDIDISGWYILDNDPEHKKDSKYIVKEGTIIKAGGFFVFEENVDFNFGLGSNDEVNLYDKDDKLVDKYAWTSHASGVYGRYPDGTGEFVDAAPSKGKANTEKREIVIDVDTKTWPGLENITILDETSIFDLKDLSGLDNHDGWLYGVNNKEGRFFVFKVVDGKVEFAPGFDAKGKAVNFKTDANDPTKLGPDSEGITVDSKGRVYIAVERDNNNKNENYNVILQVADPFKDQKVMVADKQWNITNLLPAVGANLGIETIEWVPFKNLNGLLYDQSKNKVFDANDYKDAYADGVFFVGMEANGHIYALILKEDETAQLIADIDSGLGGVMGMDYDLSNNVLWAQTDDGYNNIHTVIQFNGTNNPTKVHMSAPAGMNPKLNNEGFVIDPSVDKDGNRNTYWFMDGTNVGAFRNGKLKADYMKDLGLTPTPGKEITSPEKPVVDEKLEALRKAYKTVIEVMPNLYTSEKADLKSKLDSAKTEKELIEIYAQAQVLNSSRVKVPAPSIEKPAPNTVYVPRPVYLPVPSVKSDKIYVSKERKYVKEGYYTRSELESLREKLVKAKKDSQITVKAAKLLLELTPNTVSKSKTKLLNLIVKAEKLQKQAQAAIDEIDDILR